MIEQVPANNNLRTDFLCKLSPHENLIGLSCPSLRRASSEYCGDLFIGGFMLWRDRDIEMTRKAGDWILSCLAPQKKATTSIAWVVILVTVLLTILFWASISRAEGLQASWYSVQSLKEEGTWKYSKGVMSNGQLFTDSGLTCASRDWPLGTKVKVTRLDTGASVVVMVTDRCNKRFAGKRIDLSYEAMRRLDGIKQGLVPVKVEVIK